MKKKIFKNIFLNLFIAALLIFCCNAGVYASTSSGNTDISDPAVDSITIDDSAESIYTYSDINVTVNFSEDDADGSQKSGLDIEGGDTITVSWTTSTSDVTFAGYSKTIELYLDDDDDTTQTVIGTAEITEDGCTITFNDNVNNLQHISGSVSFKIKVDGDIDKNGTTGSITSGDVTTTVKILQHDYSGGTERFSHKSATYTTDGSNTITWSIWLNENYRTDLSGNIVITDTLPDTETFDSFVYFTSRDKNDNWEAITRSLSGFNTGDRSFSVSDDGKTITITIPASDLTAPITGLVVFKTKSTASVSSTVENTANVTYTIGGSTYEDTDTESMTVPNPSGSISGTSQGKIEITKVVDGTPNPIKGVTFRIYQVTSASDTTRVSGWYNKADYAEIVTGSDGTATLSGLNDAYYEIEEVTTNLPNWIATPSNTSVYCTISDGSTAEVTIENSVKTETITATNYWTQNDSTTADTSSEDRTVYFQLYRNGTALTDKDMPDNQKAIQAVVTKAGESSADVSWTNLPLYDNSGNAYTYTVKEVDAKGNDYTPEGYTKTESGLTVTNKKNITYSDITATKNWVQADGTTADTSDHPTIYFKLYRSISGGDAEVVDGAEIKKVETASGESTASVIWENLPETDSAGNAYTYTVKEVDADGNDYTPDGYTKSEDGLTVTNSKDITYSNITATKNWMQNDGTTADTSDHPTIYFKLYRSISGGDAEVVDGAEIKKVETASGESTASVIWENLPETDSAGNEYTYTVKEVDAEGNDYTPTGYTKSEDGLTVTNNKNITYSDVTATKNWVQADGTTADTNDHPTIYFQLYRDGTALTDKDMPDDQTAVQEVVTESGKSSATVTWKNLPETDSAGNAYTYTVKEVDADGNDYTPEGYTKTESGLTVTNSKEITYSDITATKNWVQNDGTTADTSDHPTIYFQLYRDGNALTDDDLSDNQTAIQVGETASGESTASVTWENLPETDSTGNAYTYTVKEVDAEGNDYTPTGYTKSEDGLTVTNSKNITYSDITATKNWVQADGMTADISDHPTIYFQLYRNGTALTDDDLSDDQSAIQAVETASGESTATVTWTNLPETDSAGNAYTYTVKEVDEDGNDYTPDGYSKSEDGLTVTNSKEITYSDVTATNYWMQNDGTTADISDEDRTVYFQLYRNGAALTDDDLSDNQSAIQAVKTASGESSATVTWTNLPETDSAGNEYTYTVKEVDAEGNDYTPTGYTKSEDGLTVTNSKNITYSDVTATKKWMQADGTTADTSDHLTIYFKLYRSISGGDAEVVDGAEIKKVETASGESTASVTWEDLPDTDSAGNAYTYAVKEVDADGNNYTPDGYTKTEDGLTVTNGKEITYSDVTATKKWTQNDGTTADTSDHPTIYFRLYRDGTALTDDDLLDSQSAIQAVETASGESSATVTWTNLPETDSAGKEYTYTVKEVDAEGNESTLDGYTQSTSDDGLTITNSKNITYSDITATKNWVQNDGTTADTSDHPTIYFQLYRDGNALTDDDLSDNQSAIQAVETGSGESSATVIWTNLPTTDSAGNAYTYTVKEVDEDGNDYTPDGYSKSEDGLTVTNSKEITYSDVTATNYWMQNDGTTADISEEDRTVYFQLYRNGTALTDDDLSDEQTAVQALVANIQSVVTAAGESSATVTWENLPETDSAGNAYTYAVKEVDEDGNDYTPDGYTKSEDGLTVTNSKEITYSDVTATNYWTQSDGTTADISDEDRTVYFQLYRDGTALTDDDLSDDQTAIQAVVTTVGESSATVTWTNLPETDSAGNVYTYSVQEVDADGNDYTPEGYTKSENGLTVTNQSVSSETASAADTDQNTTTTDKTDNSSQINDFLQNVKTGVNENSSIGLILFALSSAAIAAVIYRKRKNNNRSI